jgi:hypothetical protein
MHSAFSLSAVALLGVLSHRCYFIYGEHHDKSPRIAQFYFIAFMSLYFACRALGTGDNDTPLRTTTRIVATYLVSLFSSIAVYRLFFHEIKGIPGPTLARLTKLYHVFNATDAKQYLWLDKLTKKYGDFVRTGTFQMKLETESYEINLLTAYRTK